MDSQDLVPVEERTIDGIKRLTVLATDLHDRLLVVRDLGTWLKGRIKKYRFVEGVDYAIFHQTVEKSGRGRPSIDYILTLDMAKELAMVENTETGRKVRRYFIECERRLLDASQPAQPQLPMPMPQQAAPINEGRLIGALINGAKGALRQVVEDAKDHILTAFDRQRADLKKLVSDLRQFDEALLERDRLTYEKLQKIQHDVRRAHSDVLVLADSISTPNAGSSALFMATTGMVEIGRVYEIAGITGPVPRRGVLSGSITRSLTKFCSKHGYMDRTATVGQRDVSYWPEAAVVAWLDESGREIIQKHISTFTTKPTQLRLIEEDRG